MIKKEIEGAALLSIYNELKDEIKAIRTDIQNLNIQQPQQSENNQELNSLLKETIVNAVNDTINAHINSRENYADGLSGIENAIQKIPKNNIGNTNNHRFLCIMLIIITCVFWVLGIFLFVDLYQRYNLLKERHEMVMRNISSDKIKK